MAAVTATIALYRALVRKGLIPRKEAMLILLDETMTAAEAGYPALTFESIDRRNRSYRQ
jgi:hypothetical protein